MPSKRPALAAGKIWASSAWAAVSVAVILLKKNPKVRLICSNRTIRRILSSLNNINNYSDIIQLQQLP